MKKVVIINPPTHTSAYSGFSSFASISPPMGLAYVAASIEQNFSDHKVTLIDANALGLTPVQTVYKIIRMKPDVICVTGFTAMMDIVFAMTRHFKRKLPEVIIIGGGYHCSALPEQTLQEECSIDIIVKGEGERTIVSVMNALQHANMYDELKNIKGITFRDDNNRIIDNGLSDPIMDLDALPMPAYDKLPMKVYRAYGWNGWDDGVRGPYASIHTARGCPYHCTFCDANVVLGRKYRTRSVESVIAELDILKNKYKCRCIRIEDETFTVDKNRVFELCGAIRKKGFHKNTKFFCGGRVNEVDMDILQELKRTGVTWINYGIESGNDEILRSIGKNFTTDDVRRVIKMTKKTGLFILGSFMLGLIGETKETCLQTIAFTQELDLDYAGFACVIPFPGNELYRYAVENNIQFPLHWSELGQMAGKPVALNKELDEQTLTQLRKKIHYEFFLRPTYFSRLMKRQNPYYVIRDYLKMAPAVLKFF